MINFMVTLVLTVSKVIRNDIAYGYSGNDVFEGGAGNDYLNGGDGDDIAVYSEFSNIKVKTMD